MMRWEGRCDEIVLAPRDEVDADRFRVQRQAARRPSVLVGGDRVIKGGGDAITQRADANAGAV